MWAPRLRDVSSFPQPLHRWWCRADGRTRMGPTWRRGAWFLSASSLSSFSVARPGLGCCDSQLQSGVCYGKCYPFLHFQIFLLPICCFSEHIVTFYKLFVLLRVLIILIKDFRREKYQTRVFFSPFQNRLSRNCSWCSSHCSWCSSHCAIRPTWKFSLHAWLKRCRNCSSWRRYLRRPTTLVIVNVSDIVYLERVLIEIIINNLPLNSLIQFISGNL